MKLGSPMVLSSRVTVPYIAAVPNFFPLVGSVPLDSGALQTPNREAFLIHEIRFNIIASSAVVSKFGPPGLSNDVGPFVRVAFRMGPYNITTEQLPMWAFSASRDFTQEGTTWRFPLAKPMFMPPGMAVFASASRPGTPVGAFTRCEAQGIAGYDYDFAMTLVGRVVTADFPRSTTVPYVSAYAPNAAPAGTGFLSTEGTLDNQLKVPVDLRYALGRVASLYSAAAPPLSGNCRSFEVADVRMSMLCQLSYGNQHIIAPQAEFNTAFDPCTRVLNLAGQTLPSGERLVFKSDAPTYTPLQNTAFMPVVSIIGDRKEAV